MNTLDLALKKVKLKKVSATHGGEWQGPCPGCGGKDRFHVWPDQHDGRGGYWCRGCEKAGDNIQFLRDFEGLSFRDACAQLGIDMPEMPAAGTWSGSPRGAERVPGTRPEFTPATHPAPADLWREKAEKFVSWAQERLAGNKEVLAWLAERGISAATAVEFRLGWNPGENGKDLYRARKGWGLPEILKDDGKLKILWIPRGLVIPHVIDGIIHRIRIRRPEGEPRYYVVPGSSMSTMVIGWTRRAYVVVESELDAISLAALDTPAGAVALGSAQAKPDTEACAVLRPALQILNALDYDVAGAKEMAWWTERFPNHARWPVPQGKDPGEAYKLGIDLEKWIMAGLPPALTITDGRGSGGHVPEVRRERNVFPEEETKEPAGETKAAPPETDPVKEETFRLVQALPAAVRELWELLRNNPGVQIINTPERYTVLRQDRYVGGRINELVFRSPEVLAYIASHPAAAIDGTNFLKES